MPENKRAPAKLKFLKSFQKEVLGYNIKKKKKKISI